GENIYPAEIENRLAEHPGVLEAAVVGVEHPVLCQEVKAFVVAREGSVLSGDELQGWCRQTLAAFKVPAAFEVVAALPRNAGGKVLKQQLVDPAGAAPVAAD